MKMKKTNKLLIIVISCLIFVVLATLLVFYIIYPTETKQYILVAWDWLNAPLPVVGVSTVMVLVFLWKLFANSSFGKRKLNEVKKEFERTEEDVNNFKESIEEEYKKLLDVIAGLSEENEKLKNFTKEICRMIPNKKVKELGEKYYGEREETVNNETETN